MDFITLGDFIEICNNINHSKKIDEYYIQEKILVTLGKKV